MGKFKKSGLIIILCLFTVLTLLFLSSCTSPSNDEKEWNRISAAGTIEDLLDFAKNLKDSRLSADVDWKIREKINAEVNPAKLFYLMGHYPERESDFKEKIAELALNAALKENTVEFLQKYIDEFADFSKSPKYIDQAKTALKNIYFANAAEQKSIALLEEFIGRYKTEDAAMSEQAAGIIDDINWESAQKGGRLEDYENYIKNTDHSQKYIAEAKIKIDEFDWNIALEKSKARDIILPLKEYADSHPDSAFFPEAARLIKQMQDDPSYSEKYFEGPTLDLLDEFILNYPGHKDTAKAMELRNDFIGDIYSLGIKEYLAAVGVGDSITRTRIIVENRTESKLIVSLPFGMYFAANSGYVQNMIIREEKTLVIEAGRKRSIYINTACMNIYRDIPDEDSYFGITVLAEDSPLIPLLRVLAANNASFAVAQAAVWQITDNPGKDIILDTLIYQDGTDAITEADYNEALRLIDMALNK